MQPVFHPLDTAVAIALRNGQPDAYDMPAERAVSDGSGNPCRYCLQDIPARSEMLIAAHRPFPYKQPYAETGPIFLCASCEQASAGPNLPPVVTDRAEFLVKPYGANHRIHTVGKIVQTSEMRQHCTKLLSDETIAYVDLRSAVNNCFICRVTRGD